MKKGLIALCFVLLAVSAGADVVTTYEVVEGKGRITETRTNVKDYSLEGLLDQKARCLRNIDSYNQQKTNCDTRIAEENTKITKIDTLISQLVP